MSSSSKAAKEAAKDGANEEKEDIEVAAIEQLKTAGKEVCETVRDACAEALGVSKVVEQITKCAAELATRKAALDSTMSGLMKELDNKRAAFERDLDVREKSFVQAHKRKREDLEAEKLAWKRAKTEMAKVKEWGPGRVKLNIGGHLFETSKGTLRNCDYFEAVSCCGIEETVQLLLACALH